KGAVTTGRLGILDASECPLTLRVTAEWVIGMIAGGDDAIRVAAEFAEDDEYQARKDLQEYQIDERDTVIGIAASGTTPYVVHGLKDCRAHGITTGCITCNPGAPVAQQRDYPVEVVVGPEVVTGMTRMKTGTAEKCDSTMISRSVMIGMERVQRNKMVDIQQSNNKLVERGSSMIQQKKGVSLDEASEQL